MKLWHIAAVNLGMIVAILLALTLGSTYSIPDLTNVSYGFPNTWAVHTTSTIVGPVNLWSVDVNALLIDLSLWLVVLAALNIIISFLAKKGR